MMLGLDYGTTTTLAFSWMDEGLREQARILSSVFIDANGRILTDEDAYRNRTSQTGKYCHSPKSLLGKVNMFADSASLAGEDPRKLICATLTTVFESLSLQDGEDIRITLTVPNAWRDRQYILMRECVFRTADKAFGSRFNKEHFAIIPEPVAAALHFIINKPVDGTVDTNYAIICDIGGGTTDLAVVRCDKFVEGDVTDLRFEVICPMEGAPGLGGDNFDKALKEFFFPNGVPAEVPDHILWNTIRAVKAQLSRQATATFPLLNAKGDILKDARKKDVFLHCTQAQFEQVIRDYLVRVRAMLEQLKEKLLDYDPHCDLSKVYLLPVGGSCRIPAIRTILKDVFKADLTDMDNELNETYDSIASGAAYYTAWMSKGIKGYRNIKIVNHLPHRLAIRHSVNTLETWIEKNSPDGTYSPTILRPVRMNPDGKTFRIGCISLFQGEGSFVDPARNELLLEIDIDEPVYAHGRSLDEIPIVMEITIATSRIRRIRLVVENGREDGSDFEYEESFNLEVR